MKYMLSIVMTVSVLILFTSSAQARDRNLIIKAAASVSAEVAGIGSPDAKFVIGLLDFGKKDSIEHLSKDLPVGDQGSTQVVQRSYGCSSGCSVGCSSGCSVGCSSGCSVGCSSGCSSGCR